MTTVKKNAANKSAVKSMPDEGMARKGGLTAAGRKFFKEKQGNESEAGGEGS